MDSRQLYNAARHLNQVVTWDKEWIHFGTGNGINLSVVEDLIERILADDVLQLIQERTNSTTVKRTEIIKEIYDLLGKQSFQIWNSTMDKVIKFDRIGVLLVGKM